MVIKIIWTNLIEIKHLCIQYPATLIKENDNNTKCSTSLRQTFMNKI